MAAADQILLQGAPEPQDGRVHLGRDGAAKQAVGTDGHLLQPSVASYACCGDNLLVWAVPTAPRCKECKHRRGRIVSGTERTIVPKPVDCAVAAGAGGAGEGEGSVVMVGAVGVCEGLAVLEGRREGEMGNVADAGGLAIVPRRDVWQGVTAGHMEGRE